MAALPLALPLAAALALAAALVLPGCGAAPDAAAAADRAAMDPHSHSRPAAVRVVDLDLDLALDFAARRIDGRATLRLRRIDPRAPLVLDTAASLELESVSGLDGSPRPFLLGPADPILGAALTIPLQPADEAVVVRYRTHPDAAALQWLDPAQTAGGRRPFVYTQGQAILTRSWIPLQDSPGVRHPYTATVRVPADPDLSAVMSADHRERVEPGLTRFRMTHPVPPYLIALAVGDLARRELSPRCAVFAEPAVIGRAAAEFEDVEAMLVTCERLYGPYRWGRYDILVLPPSFPFGGMENPCLTFATPTILAGDGSLVALIAHELAHSWSGNLVTNASWNDFWLNEGFTVHVEQRIVEALFGAERARMEIAIGLQGLRRELPDLPPADRRLRLDLGGRDPDEGLTAVAYDKGAAFLRRLEHAFGRPRFDAWLRGWFERHAFGSVTTEDFLRWLEAGLLPLDPAAAATIDLGAWLDGTGLPADLPEPAIAVFRELDAARARWLDGPAEPLPALDGLPTMAWLHFLGGLPAGTPRPHLDALDRIHGLTDTGNSEILAAWLDANLRAGFASLPAALDARLEAFLLEVGRRKFVEPLYRALLRSESGTARARAIYREARPRYHAVTRGPLDALFAESER
jgi:hypothetical protein